MAEITLQAQIQSLRTAVEGRLAADEPATRETLPWQPGERVTATVEALRQGERALLRIGAFVFDAKLPAGAEVGQRLNLIFVSSSPRATFALSEEPETAPAPASRQGVEISPAARSLNALVRSVARERPAQPTPIHDPVPLLPAPADHSAPLAAALQRSVQRSGLFYESHLAQWAAGERPLAALLDEPQGRIPARGGPSPNVAVMPTTSGAEEDADAAQRQSGSMTSATTAKPAASSDPIDHRVMPQVRAQIESLDARQIVWQGQAWPGLPVEWRVDEPPDESRSPDQPLPWTSRLRLTFPVLGEVVADLILAGDALRVQLHTPRADTRAALAAAGELLRDGLQRASIRLTQLTIDE